MARERIAKAQAKQKAYIDRKRQDQRFDVGDLVYLSTTNLSDTHLPKVPKKLWPRYIGPFGIVKRINDNAYQLADQGSFRLEGSPGSVEKRLMVRTRTGNITSAGRH